MQRYNYINKYIHTNNNNKKEMLKTVLKITVILIRYIFKNIDYSGQYSNDFRRFI